MNINLEQAKSLIKNNKVIAYIEQNGMPVYTDVHEFVPFNDMVFKSICLDLLHTNNVQLTYSDNITYSELSMSNLSLTYNSNTEKYEGSVIINGGVIDSVGTCTVTGATNASFSVTNNTIKVMVPASSITSLRTLITLTCTGAKRHYYTATKYTCKSTNGNYVKPGGGYYTCSDIQDLYTYEYHEETQSLSKSFTIVKKSKVTISKTDATGENELPGATLSILGSDNKVLKNCIFDNTNHKITYSSGNDAKACTWTSEDVSYVMEGLPAGKYYLVEDIAPTGYEKSSEKIEIEITENGAVKDKIIMKNEPKKVPVPDTLGARSAIILTIALLSIASGIGAFIYVKKKKANS